MPDDTDDTDDDADPGHTDFDMWDEYDVVISTHAKRSRYKATDSGLSASDAHDFAELLDAGREAAEERVSERAVVVAKTLARTLRRAEPVDEDE